MEAIVIKQFGSADEFYETEVDLPQVTDDTVLVGVNAFSINPMDIAARMGKLPAPFSANWSFPLVLGWDFAGTVAKVGKNVTGYKVGDRVFGGIPSSHAGNNGSYGRFVVTTPDIMAKIPAGLSFDQAAALPVAGGTAYVGIVENLKVKPNDTILVQGGAGGVGLFAVQIAKAQGAKVIATASAPHNELLKQLGVDQVVDYHKQTVGDVVKDVDAVFDTAGDIAGGLTALKSGGKLVTVGGQPTPEQTSLPDKSVSFQSTHATTSTYEHVANLVTSGKVKIQLQTLPRSADNVIDAQKQVEAHHMTGKFVIHVKD
ncbi:NADP-dependent oxidoreductase [Secundilactobacillus hailunensis]|uniref:NADP-dependent oxidoreductase n=1 Tax=Secundilactobacillus hailunensis TaxID=2559923 RepID=A0ABW1T714_9LACO|nr:NADP-dependent oxidoreductase [Secundilactobacillus hailunensis]